MFFGFLMWQPCRHAPTVRRSSAVCFVHILFLIRIYVSKRNAADGDIFIIPLQAMTFHKCKNLKIRHLLVIDSQQMHVSFTNCLRVVASDLKVIAPAFSPNTDGIHISASRGVTVTNSIISTGQSS